MVDIIKTCTFGDAGYYVGIGIKIATSRENHQQSSYYKTTQPGHFNSDGLSSNYLDVGRRAFFLIFQIEFELTAPMVWL